MKKICHVFVILFIFYSLQIFADNSMAERPDVQNFIAEMVKKHDFDRQKLNTLFCYVHSNSEVITKLNKPYESKPWYIYRDFFLKPERIQKGAAYWREHLTTLNKVAQQYGVPAKIIVAIIGVESLYGKDKGNYPVLTSLATLAFDNYRRTEFFKSELAEFLLLTREQHLMPLTMNGSYAGAIGLPQFMPSSYRQYAIDFVGKGHSDLMNNHEDAIASVANYLHKHGWVKDELVVLRASLATDQTSNFTQKGLKPYLTQQDLKKLNITLSQPLKNHQRVSIISLQGKDAKEYWAGLQNFYVISTYNKSEQYVLAVSLLADKIADLYAKQN